MFYVRFFVLYIFTFCNIPKLLSTNFFYLFYLNHRKQRNLLLFVNGFNKIQDYKSINVIYFYGTYNSLKRLIRFYYFRKEILLFIDKRKLNPLKTLKLIDFSTFLLIVLLRGFDRNIKDFKVKQNSIQ